MKRHIVLVGLPGSGKSIAGRIAATTLRAPFVDVDAAIEAKEGRSVRQIFAEDGEAAFRLLERQAVIRVLSVLPSIVAPGGGWAAQPGNLEEATMRAVAVYLETDPAVAAVRLGSGDGRPLLEGRDPTERLRELLVQRERHYRSAQAAVVTDGKTPEEVARELVELARTRAGW